jgi:GNAT superfamily N-acetyltransferase
MSQPRLIVTIRPAAEADTPQVMELLGQIWGGEDYVPQFWLEWLRDRQGRLVVAENEGRILGTGRLARKSKDEWWLQGLRVHPEFEGQGIASQIHDTLVALWRTQFGGTLRLSTVATRYPVHHLCERSGFTRIGDFSFYRAPALLPDALHPLAFRPMGVEEIETGLAFFQSSPLFDLQAGMWALGWEWVRPSFDLLAEAVGSGQAWWWRDRTGLLAFMPDEEDTQTVMPFIQHIACPLEDLSACLMDYRRLVGHLGYAQAAWEPNLVPPLVQALEAAGFQRTWDNSTYLYAQESVPPD